MKLSLPQLMEKWNSELAGKQAEFMIQPSHRPMRIEECAQGAIPAWERICNHPHSFIVEAWIFLPERSLEIRQLDDEFWWKEHELEAGEVKHLPVAFDRHALWVEVWKPGALEYMQGIEVLLPSHGYFKGFVQKEKK
ncbi:hypothetical protein LGV61_05370 [Desulfurispirillum indicum]|uniref:hypothetical protein n=1 Tax=Desulfurispirillum indicum TaxID=936456 RepID=UPI001CF964C4|nr:hypothetical protein [Desulfurispirillum indicum]UCZ57705.1 hypothetical protein LGV61_05370 [Desulfurispirillum indicum]